MTNLPKSKQIPKFCEISILLLSHVVQIKSKVEILQNCVAFLEYMNFNWANDLGKWKCKRLTWILGTVGNISFEIRQCT